MNTVLLAKKSKGGVGKYSWEKTGPEGAIEVDSKFAYELLSIAGNDYTIVKPEDVKPAPKPEPKVEAKVEVEETSVNELSDAIEVASPTKRRAKG
jgi:hypothetical protein